MSKSPKLVFFGTDKFSTFSLKKLIDSNYDIVAVVSQPDRPAGRGRQLRSPEVATIARKHSLRLLQPERLSSLRQELEKLGPSHGVLVAYGRLIPQSLIDIFSGGIINVHPSLLPKYRGPSPVEAAILNGDKKTGVSLIRLTAGMDEGPIYCQKVYPLTGREDRVSLNHDLGIFSAEYLCSNLSKILNGEMNAFDQDNTEATYCKLLTKKDGVTDWQEPAELIERKIRAYKGFPKLRGPIFGHEIIALRGEVVRQANEGQLIISCKPGLLKIDELIAPSGKSMSGEDFMRGYEKS